MICFLQIVFYYWCGCLKNCEIRTTRGRLGTLAGFDRLRFCRILQNKLPIFICCWAVVGGYFGHNWQIATLSSTSGWNEGCHNRHYNQQKDTEAYQKPVFLLETWKNKADKVKLKVSKSQKIFFLVFQILHRNKFIYSEKTPP